MMPSYVQVESCCFSFKDVAASYEGGVDRVELCVDPVLGGVTPSLGLIKQVKKSFPELPLWILIRPRGGGFVYNLAETEIMLYDIKSCIDCGVDGVVIGALDRSNQLDFDIMETLIHEARPINWSFHRAFDQVIDKKSALDYLKAVGCERILTSGGVGAAVDHIRVLKELVVSAEDKIQIMAGGKVRIDNVEEIVAASGVPAVHSSMRNSLLDEGDYQTIESGIVRNFVSLVRSLSK